MSLASFPVAAPTSHETPPRPASEAATPQVAALFGQLHKVTSDEEAKPLEDQILTLFLESGSPSVDILMTRTAGALAAGDRDTAQKLLDAVTQVAPGYAEGWHQRGKLQAIAGDDEGAIISLQKAVTLNPRQFAAMAELGSILVQYGDSRDALTVLRRARTLDPHFANLDREVQQLSREVEGERI